MPDEKRVALREMTLEALHEYYRGFQSDPDIYMDMRRFVPYRYTPERVDAYFAAKQAVPDRKNFLIFCGETPIGELCFKRVDPTRKTCELSIHLQNDTVKNRGYGTQAERLALEYAFTVLGMETVFADSVWKNARSQHVLEKVGFRLTGQDETFRYYRCDRDAMGKEGMSK